MVDAVLMILGVFLDVILRTPYWLLLSTPVLIAVYFLAKYIRALQISNAAKHAYFVPITVFLLAPMPMGIFVAMIPNAYAVFAGIEYYLMTWPWFVLSMPTTAGVVYYVFGLYLRAQAEAAT